MTAVLPLRAVVDTNVATTADGLNPSVSAEAVAACGLALQRLVTEGHVFVDAGTDGESPLSSIVAEYRRNLDGKGQRGPGSAFLKWLLVHEWNPTRVTRVSVTRLPGNEEAYAELPTPADGTLYDPSDRKFLATAASHAERPPVLQAMDVKWWGWQAALATLGVRIHFLCPEEIEAAHKAKYGR